MSYKCLIIDDVPLQAHLMKTILESSGLPIHVIDICENVFEARNKITQSQPDVVFLDIQLPHVNGIDFIKSFEDRKFQVIYTTAHEQYALEAFKLGALDYILKPINPEAVVQALQNAIRFIASKASSVNEMNGVDLRKRSTIIGKLKIQHQNSILLINFEDVLYLEADKNYTLIYTVNGKKIVSSKPLKIYEAILPDYLFFRIHKSYIINTGYITTKIRNGNKVDVVLADTYKLPVSQPKQARFRKFLLDK